MLRRKLKNRVAAQTARDRKKELMGTLEQQVTKLMEQNKRLLDENKKLKSQSSNLLHENQQLKERLGNNVSSVGTKSETLGSAVSYDLLPRGHAQTLSRSMMPYATSVLTMSLCLALFSKSVPPSQKKMMELSLRSLEPTQGAEVPSQHQPLIKWWGPQQQSWNPSTNL